MSSEELTGRTLGDFVVRHRIGEGGFGAVYRAEQPALGREAVIKALHGRHRSSKTVIQRFLREARLASKLDHPYAAHIYSFGVETDGVMWIAMEYVRGQTLHDLLRSKGPLPLEELVPLLDRICEVLQAAHDLGIVHRDIKPPNVMVVSRSGRAFPKLLDFGIAKLSADEPPTGEHKALTTPPITPSTPSAAPLPAADTYPDRANPTVSFVGAPGGALAAMEQPRAVEADDRLEFTMYQAPETPEHDGAALTEVGATVGSPPYMAPEQWQDAAAASTRTDLYALGILTYEALTNRRPFGGATVMAIAYAHQEDPVPPLGGTFPLALDDVMATVLAKKPTDRYQTALEFAQAFRAAAGFGSQPLPAFDDDLRASVEASLPQPIAEAVAAYQAANNPHQGRDALRDIVTTSLRFIAMLALAAYAQVPPAGTTFSPLISDALRELRRRGLRDDQWLELARELVAPFQERPETHPLPELVRVLRGGAGDVLAVVVERRIADPDPLATIRELLPQVTRMLRAFAFLADYTLVVSADGRAEAWMGVRRPRRVAVEITARTLDPGQPTLVDGGGRPTIVLYPLIQTRSPMPGAPPELFMLDGRGRRGARLVALPQTLERQDESVWDWIGEKFAERDRDTPVSLTGDVGKPYRGLAAFTAEDAEVFVGREREIDAALNRLKTAALVAVVGPSGAGKSSFVHAGIVPSLPEGWTTVSVRPGTTPLATLQSRLRRAGVAITELGPQPGETTTVIVVDQFEELFTLGAPDDERRDYVRLLLAAADSDKLRVVITLRDDFLARATQMPELRDRLPQALFLLGTPARADLVRILKQPLARRGFDFEDPSLPEKMVDDVAEAPGALALLSFTASKLWDLRDRHFRQLTRKAYDALGGVAGALAQHAEATLAELSHSEQRLARTTFRHLVSAEGTRAVLTRGELAQLMRDPNAGAVVEKLIAARLLVSTESETGGDDRIEIIHEALLAAWPRLAEWRREDADGARLRDQVRAAARQWNERKQPRGLLWRDDAVAELKLWRARHPQPLTDGEEAFVTASLAESTRVHRMRRLVIGGVILTLAIAVAVLFWARSSVSKVAARDHARVVAELVERGRRAVLSGDSIGARSALAEARRLGADDTSMLRFLEHSAAEPIAARLTTLTGHSALVDSVEFSPSGAEVLTASTDGTANLWDVGRSAVRVTLSGCRGALLSAHYEPSGKHIAAECDDGHVRIYSAAGSLEHVLAVGGTRSVVKERPFTRFSPDGTRLATDLFGVLEVWDVATGERVWGLDPALRQTRIAFSPDGATLATLSGQKALATLWNATTGERIRELTLDATEWTPYNVARSALAFSPDGIRLVTIANEAEVAQIWTVATGTVAARLESRGGAFTHLAISADGQHIVTASRDHSLQIWSLESGHLVHGLTPVASQLADLVIAPNSALIGGAFSDGRVMLWNMDSGTLIAELQGHDGPVWSLAFDRGVDRLVTGGSDTTAMVWNLQSPTTTHVVSIGVVPIEGELRGNYLLTATEKATVIDVGTATVVARTQIGKGADARFIDDRRIAIVDRHGTISVWTLATNEVRAIAKHRGEGDWVVTDGRERIAAFSGGELVVTDTSHELYRVVLPATITTVAFAPDGGVIAGDVGGSIIRVDGAERTRVLAHTRRTRQLFVLSDGRIVSAGGNVVQLWTPDGALLHTFTHASGDVTHITIDHAGRKLASASLDATVRIWDLTTYEETVSIAQPSYADWPTFSPDDSFLATTSDQGTVRVWDAQTGKQLAQLQALPSSMLQISDTAIIAIDRLTIIFPR